MKKEETNTTINRVSLACDIAVPNHLPLPSAPIVASPPTQSIDMKEISTKYNPRLFVVKRENARRDYANDMQQSSLVERTDSMNKINQIKS